MTLHFTHEPVTEDENNFLKVISKGIFHSKDRGESFDICKSFLTEYSRMKERVSELERIITKGHQSLLLEVESLEQENKELQAEIARMKEAEGWIGVDDENTECRQYIVTYFNPMDKHRTKYVICLWRGRDGWYYDNSEKERADGSTLTVTHYKTFPSPPNQ